MGPSRRIGLNLRFSTATFTPQEHTRVISSEAFESDATNIAWSPQVFAELVIAFQVQVVLDGFFIAEMLCANVLWEQTWVQIQLDQLQFINDFLEISDLTILDGCSNLVIDLTNDSLSSRLEHQVGSDRLSSQFLHQDVNYAVKNARMREKVASFLAFWPLTVNKVDQRAAKFLE